MFSITYAHPQSETCSILFQNQIRLAEVCLRSGTEPGRLGP
jgi:hypothetical protein